MAEFLKETQERGEERISERTIKNMKGVITTKSRKKTQEYVMSEKKIWR